MSILRKAGSAGFLVAVSAAIAVSAGGVASADDGGGGGAGPARYYSSYGDCMTAGNIAAQQGQLHGFHCSPVGGGGGPTGSQPGQWQLVVDF
ncbi:MAG: hypothetical protein ACRDZY_16840 [Acidimicrobiales bacterium]